MPNDNEFNIYQHDMVQIKKETEYKIGKNANVSKLVCSQKRRLKLVSWH